MDLPRSLRNVLLALSLALLAATLPAAAQTDEIDAMLVQRDWAVMQYYGGRFPADTRWEGVLGRIEGRVNAHLHEVFHNSEEDVTYGVFLSDMGFNGVAWHRIVILDSLLLDTLRRLAEGITVYGRLKNDYSDRLALYIGRLGIQGGYGSPLMQPYVDPNNPYGIPPPPGLDYQASQRAERIFEDVLAAWVCHELSHCYLGHSREKIQREIELHREFGGRMNPYLLQQQVQAYLTYRLTPLKELEADRAGAELAFRSGYTVDGFRNWYGFCDMIEEHTGAAWVPLRTHPPGRDRLRAVLEVYARLQEASRRRN